MGQTTYQINLNPAAYPGQVADDTQVIDRLSILAQAAAIPYGLHVVIDSTNTGGFDQLCGKLPASAADVTNKSLGVAQAEQNVAQDPTFSVPTYAQLSVVPVARKGRFWVKSESAVVDGAAVYVRFATGDNGTVVGSYGGILDTSTVGNVILLKAVWRGSYAAGYAVLELDLT